MSSYGYNSPIDSSTSNVNRNNSTSSIPSVNLNVVAPQSRVTSSSDNTDNTIGQENIKATSNVPSSKKSQNNRKKTNTYTNEVTLQFTTKTNFAYDLSDKYADDVLVPFAVPDSLTPVYTEEETYGIETKTIEWTIGSNAVIIWGHHLDGTPWVQDNSDVDGGGLYLVEVGGDGTQRTVQNAWYEEVEISGTAINPDNGKLPTEHIGQISRGAQETDMSFTYDPETGEHAIGISLKPWLGIPDYHYGSIPIGRGYNDGDYSSESDSNPPLYGIPGIAEQNTNVGDANYGSGDFTQSYVYANYYDGRGQMISNESLNQLPRDQVTNENVERAKEDTNDPGNEGWIAGYRDAPRSGNVPGLSITTGAPWFTEGQWLTVEEVGEGFYGEGKDNTTGYNYLTTSQGVRGNRTSSRGGSLPPTVSYDFAVANSGLIMDRDGIERWSGQYKPDDNRADPYQLKANDLIVTQVSHWDERGISQMRNYCRQRYELYNILRDTYPQMEDADWDDAGFNWYRLAGDDASKNSGKFPQFPESYTLKREGVEDVEIVFNLPTDFDDIIRDKVNYGSLSENPEQITFRGYEIAVLNAYEREDGKENYIDSYKGWGMLNSKWARLPFIDMTACLSVVPAIEIPADIPADVNGDGQVNGADLTLLLADWGNGKGDDLRYDLNGDGVVDGADLTLLLNSWGRAGVEFFDYSKTFRPPLNWDPTDRGSAPYITEIDDIDDYTIDGPGAKPLGSEQQEDIPVGQIGYPNTAMDGGTATAWEIYSADSDNPRYDVTKSQYPQGLQMSLTDTYWPELKIASKSELVGNGNDDDPSTWNFQSTVRLSLATGKAFAKSLRLGGHILWNTAAESDNRVQGCHGGFDICNDNYGSQEGAEAELLSVLAFDRNLDPENLDRAIRDENHKNISPSSSWVRYHYGTDWDKKPNVSNDGLVPKRDNFNLRHVIRRAITQRGIDIYGGYRSGGKYVKHNAGHTDWWDVTTLVGLSCTQHEDWVDMLNTGSIGSEKNGTKKNFSHQIAKTDPDYTYDAMDNTGTFPGDIGQIGPEGMANLTNIPGGEKQGNGLGAYTHNTLRYKDLSVKSVNDFTIIPYPEQETGASSTNEYYGEPIRPDDLPNVFPNQLITVYPPVGGQCGNQIDSLYYKLKEIVEADKALFDEATTGKTQLAKNIRDRSWRGLYTQDIGSHKTGDDVTTWVGTDTDDRPWGSPSPVTDQPLNNLQSGVEPEWVADVDKPYSFLVGVSAENLVRYDNQLFNTMRLDADGTPETNGNYGTPETNGNYYRPHKDLWKNIIEDFRPIDRWDVAGSCDDSYAADPDTGYVARALEDATQQDTNFAPLTGIYPRGYNPIGGGNDKHWSLLTNQDFMSSNYHRGIYVKNTTLKEDGTKSDNYGKISLVVANITEHVRNSECVKNNDVKTTPRAPYDANDMNPGASSIELEGARESINGKNDNTDLGPTARAMNFLILDDIGLKDDVDAGLNATVDIAHNLDIDFADRDVPMPGVNSWANGGGYGNVASFGGFKSYDWVYTRGSFTYAMAARLFTGIKDDAKQQGSTKVRHKPLSEILDALPAYYAKLFVKYPTFWNNPIGRSILEEDTNTNHTIFSGGNSEGVGWNDGRTDTKLKNWPSPKDNPSDNFYGGDQWPELMRALFNQELLGRISGKGDDGTQVASQWRDPSDGRKWCVTMKEKLWRWKNEPGVIGKVMSTNTNTGQLDFTGQDVIQLSDPPENITALAKSIQGTEILFQDFTYTFDTPDGQQASMTRNNSDRTGENFTGTIGTTEVAGATFPAPDWVTHSRIFTLDDKKVNYAGEKTNFSSPAGLDVSFTILGRNKNSDSSGDLDDVGRPVANGDVTNADGNGTDVTPENRPVATNSNYSDYKGNDGFHIKSSPGGALPYKQFVRGKSLYIWSHGINRWQELVLVSENVNTDDGEKITSHGPRSGATKGADNDYSESGFQDDPIEWEQVWMLPNETQVLDGESGTPKALAVWANLANSFARDGLNWLTVFYADPQSQ